MKLFMFIIKATLHIAIEKGNLEIIKVLLANEKLNVNQLYVFIKENIHIIFQ